MVSKDEIQAHKELNKKIFGCGCCPLNERNKYCDNCQKAVVDFMNKYGAGVLTRDELVEELEKHIEFLTECNDRQIQTISELKLKIKGLKNKSKKRLKDVVKD